MDTQLLHLQLQYKYFKVSYKCIPPEKYHVLISGYMVNHKMAILSIIKSTQSVAFPLMESRPSLTSCHSMFRSWVTPSTYMY